MTKQSSFKARVRARMAKTGERYAAARFALLKTRDSGGDTPAGATAQAGTLIADLGALA